MNNFDKFIYSLDITNNVTDEEIEKAQQLLKMYPSILRRSTRTLTEIKSECHDKTRQSVSEFINLAVDYDSSTDIKRLTGRLADIGTSMNLLEIMEQALCLVRDDPVHGEMYYKILDARYFDAYCRSNEDACFTANISLSTYYRNIKGAVKLFAANLWCVVVPDIIRCNSNDTQNDTYYDSQRKAV